AAYLISKPVLETINRQPSAPSPPPTSPPTTHMNTSNAIPEPAAAFDGRDFFSELLDLTAFGADCPTFGGSPRGAAGAAFVSTSSPSQSSATCAASLARIGSLHF